MVPITHCLALYFLGNVCGAVEGQGPLCVPQIWYDEGIKHMSAQWARQIAQGQHLGFQEPWAIWLLVFTRRFLVG